MASRASTPREVTADQLGGFKQLKRVAQLLTAVHSVGCDRDKAHNRELHFDDYVLLILLYLFNPMLDSMRTLQRAASLEEVQKRLGIKRFSLGSFSESCTVFEPERLQCVVDQLAVGLRPIDRHELLKTLPGKLTLVDASVINTLCTVSEAMYLPMADGKYRHAWRLHMQFDVDHHVPGAWEITEPKNTGKSDEKSALRRKLRSDHTYVMDRWYAQFTLWNDIKAAGSSYVCRVRDNSVYDVIEDRALTQEAIDAGVISDQIVNIGLSKSADKRPDHKTRLICIKSVPHAKRGKVRGNGYGQTGPTSDGTLRIVTDLLDGEGRASAVPAHIIAFLYEYRWVIEIFFRFFKQILGCRHLLSTKVEGIRIQVFAAVICCLMLNQLTGKKPNKMMILMMSFYLQGLASEAEMLRELNRPDNTGVKTRARDAALRKLIYGT